MYKKAVILVIIFLSLETYSQRYRDYEIGPMVNYEHTTLYVSSDVFNSSGDGKSISGFEPSYAAGLYFIYYFKPKFGLGTELYFQRTTSSELESGEFYNSVTFMPYFNYDPFRQISNWHFGAGFGLAFIQEAPDYGSVVKEEDIRVITIPVKLSTTYRIRNRASFELGAQTELLEVVNEQVRRFSLFVGAKIPLNRVYGRYR